MNNGCLNMSCVGHRAGRQHCVLRMFRRMVCLLLDNMSGFGQLISYFAVDHEDDCCPMWSESNGLGS